MSMGQPHPVKLSRSPLAPPCCCGEKIGRGHARGMGQAGQCGPTVWQAKFGAHAMVGHRWAWRVAHWYSGARVAHPGQNVPPTTPSRCHNAEFSHLMPRGSRWSSPLPRSIFWPILCAPGHFFAYFKCPACAGSRLIFERPLELRIGVHPHLGSVAGQLGSAAWIRGAAAWNRLDPLGCTPGPCRALN